MKSKLFVFNYLITITFFIFSCGPSEKRDLGRVTPKTSKKSSLANSNTNTNFNIFIENSGSMDGYISQPSEFKTTLISFSSNISTYFHKTPNISFVNDGGTCPQFPKDIEKWLLNLNPKNYRNQCKSNGNSSLDDIIDKCTNNMKNNVNIIFSDCVLSYYGTNINGVKTAQEHLASKISNKLLKENISTIIVKFNSKFLGPYYNESKKGVKIELKSEINRPYYALIFGEKESLNYYLSKIDLKKYPGFEYSYTLVANSKNSSINSIITYENKMGSFEFVKPASQMKIVNAETKKGTSEFQFSINADLKNLPLGDDYIRDIKNYSINENFNLKSIEKIDNANRYSHRLTFYTTDLKQISNLIVGIKYSIPEWVKNTGSDIDDDPMDSKQQKQTFGFKYLMMGVSEAYIANNDSLQFKIPITINKNSPKNGLPWVLFFAISIILAVFIYIKNKK